jgi:hypothetical protein
MIEEINNTNRDEYDIVTDTWQLEKKPMQLDQMILEAKNNYETNKYRSYKECYEAGVDAMAELICNESKTVREEITGILYQNSIDDSECIRIKFENIQKVIDELNRLLTFKN